METALEKFLRYAKYDTQSSEEGNETPSTKKQFELANQLVKELRAMGISDAEVDEHCYVMATVPSNIPEGHAAYGKVPTIGLIAHVDTSPDVSGADVKPQIIENYQGGDLVLPGDNSVVITVAENPNLNKCIGHTIVTTDGTTLLGSDDKSGIAEIMAAVEHLLAHPEILHGKIRIGFTPDEEIGKGTIFFDINKFAADVAYTLDGDLPGELNKETFSANAAIIRVFGRDIHPGMAKDVMINSVRVASDIVAKLPRKMSPEHTSGYEPYIHPHQFTGSVGESTIKFLLRDFKTEGLDEQKRILEAVIAEVQPMYPKAKIELEIIEYYRNMREKLDEKPEVLECLWAAAERAGANPHWEPIRGGTDGSRLTEMGLPTPNIFTGGQNFHSRTEWLSVNGMNIAVQTVLNLVQVFVEKYSK